MKTKLKIEMIETGDLIPYAQNSRTHSREQVTQIASSIEEFGFTNPVLIDENNGIIGKMTEVANLTERKRWKQKQFAI